MAWFRRNLRLTFAYLTYWWVYCLFSSQRWHGTDRQTEGRGVTRKRLPREGRLIVNVMSHGTYRTHVTAGTMLTLLGGGVSATSSVRRLGTRVFTSLALFPIFWISKTNVHGLLVLPPRTYNNENTDNILSLHSGGSKAGRGDKLAAPTEVCKFFSYSISECRAFPPAISPVMFSRTGPRTVFPQLGNFHPAVKAKIWKLSLTRTPDPNRSTRRGIFWKQAFARTPEPNRSSFIIFKRLTLRQ